MRPDAIGIGGQKCMTSWLHAVAGAHPGVAASEPKELDFFSHAFDRGYAWYEARFATGKRRGVGFDCSPSYLTDPRAARRAAAYHPAMKLVVLLRDPVERAYSNHLHEIAKGHIRPCAFADGLGNNPSYLDQGAYARHLAPWLDSFPRGAFLFMICEEAARSPEGAARQLYEFLGVGSDHAPAVLAERRNESDRPRSALMRRMLRSAGGMMRAAGLETVLAGVKRMPPVAGALRWNSVALRDEVPAPTEDDRRRLEAAFAPDVIALARILGRDTLPWPTWRAAAGCGE